MKQNLIMLHKEMKINLSIFIFAHIFRMVISPHGQKIKL